MCEPGHRHWLLHRGATSRKVDLEALTRHLVCLVVQPSKDVHDVPCRVAKHDARPVDGSKVMMLQSNLIISSV